MVVHAAPVAVPDPPLRARRLETRLMSVLGAGFGLGVAMVSTRLLSGLAPGPAAAGMLGGAVLGVLTTAWMIRTRTLLHDRAVLERWSLDEVAAVRAVVEERVATRMLGLESAVAAAVAGDEDTGTGRRIAELEAELRALSRGRRQRSVDDHLVTGR
ncbi:hypothetical protein [Mycobacterium sp. NAZ190054]|uniref:hypothetical protein n=1 Tax=Mycobacterium sp. NAZ190054 TaxID=1747766 RepID=UPI000791A5D1|nr:hypothetical protein [Mycobacterium sp. NAZ190054]KWX58401.1 hypothetical protein ASJ79_30415 [Mycobacterium sp. NAZ190054]